MGYKKKEEEEETLAEDVVHYVPARNSWIDRGLSFRSSSSSRHPVMEGRELHVLFIRSFSRLPSDDMKNIKQFHFLFFFVSNNHFSLL